ncbi:MAG: ADP-ribose diphosphatase [SAR86 cluster bacterium]|uniref:ADP-ribose pyrophosphatase n=1 Tax=SAR86 cluster bacterium TaxID=2030880 RepID=A0A2A5CFY9_9GAMM|nr:MAG: ADP-ribose diphosphatase [SAR86 cluster bacterium]
MRKTLQKTFSQSDVNILSEKTCYSGFLKIKQFQLKCRLFQGGWSEVFTRELVLRTPGVGVLLYDSKLDKLLMIEQFRIGCLQDDQNGPWALELVAGLIEDGEGSADVARREAEEEAGITLNRLISVCEYYNSPGASSEKLSIYCALIDLSNIEEGIFGLASEAENIRSIIIDRSTAEAAVQSGQINNAMSIIAIQWLALNLHELQHDQ